MAEVNEVPNGKKKQDVVVVDGSGSGRCFLWKEKIGSLKEGESLKSPRYVRHRYMTKQSGEQ